MDRAGAETSEDVLMPTDSSLMQNRNKHNFNIILGNIEGLSTFRRPHKVAMLKEMAIENNVGLIALTESHLTDEIYDAEIKMSGYQHFRADRVGARKGGVIVYMRNDIAKQSRLLSSGSRNCHEWLTLLLHDIDVMISIVYRPPVGDVSSLRNILSIIEKDINDQENSDLSLCICGDFNLPSIRWDILETQRGGHHSGQAEVFVEFVKNRCMEQYVCGPTRGNNTLDLFLTDNPDIVKDITIQDSTQSDHRIILIESGLTGNSDKQPPENSSGISSFNFWHKEANWDEINRKLSLVNWDVSSSPEDLYKMILTEVERAADGVFPIKILNKRRKNIPRDRKVLMRRKTKLNKRLKRETNESIILRLKSNIRDVEQMIILSHETESRNIEKNAIDTIKVNPKFFYKYARSKSKIKSSIGPLIVDGHRFETNREMCEVLCEQYKSVFIESSSDEYYDNVDHLEETMNDININECDFIEAIDQIKANSAAGPDAIPAVLIKKCVNSLANCWSFK